jgi:uncharacterized protein with beta-barrel porin domain
LRNLSPTTLYLSGTVRLSVSQEWLATHEVMPGFLESAPGAGGVYVAPDINIAFSDVTLHGELVSSFTSEIRVTRVTRLEGAHDGLEHFVGELGNLQYTDNFAYALLNPESQNVAEAVRNITAASPLGFSAMPALLVRAASDSTAVLRDRLESRRDELRSLRQAAVPTDNATSATETEATAEDAEEETASVKPSTLTGVDFYFSGSGNILKNGSGSSTPVFDYNSGSVIAGVDAPLGTAFIAGASVAGHFGQARFHDGSGKIDQSQYRGTAYLSASATSWLALDASISGGVSRFESKRTIFGLAGATGAYDIGAAFYANTSFSFLGDSLAIAPYAGVEYLHIFVDSFKESGVYSPAALRLNFFEQDSLQVKVGTNFIWKVAPGGVPTRFILGVSYGRELGDTESDLRAVLYNAAYGRKFNVRSVYTSEDTFQVGPSVEISNGRSSLSAGYRYETDFADRVSHHIRAEFRVKF